MGNRGIRVVGFLVAGAALVALADVAPDAAIGLAAVIGLGVLLTHGTELTQLTNAFQAAAPGHISKAPTEDTTGIHGDPFSGIVR